MTAPASPPDWDAIARFLAGESSADEASAVRVWLAANPADREIVERLRQAGESPADVDVEAALARVNARIDAGDTNVRPIAGGRRRSPWRAVTIAVLPIAAVLAAIVAYRGRLANHPSAEGVRTNATAVGQRDSVQLADGSRVLLGPQSRLVIPSDYAARRTVDLTGDAYFDVKHDAAHPFTVRTSKALVEDIGTAFTVESDAEVMTSVAVVTGSVRLRGQGSSADAGVVLAAGDRGSIDVAGRTRADRQVVREEDTEWTRGNPQFRDAPLALVAAEIRRWYGVTVVIPDSSLRERRVTASFNGEPADRVLNILGLLLGAHVDRQGNTATISAARGAAASR